MANILQRLRGSGQKWITVILSIVYGQAHLHCCDEMARPIEHCLILDRSPEQLSSALLEHMPIPAILTSL